MHREVRQSCRRPDREKESYCSGQSTNTTNESSVKHELTTLCLIKDAKDEVNTVKEGKASDKDGVEREAVRFVL